MTDLALHSRAASVLDTLRDEILTGQYRPGERLPSERELAARFETSRGAVREALKKLEQLGIAAIHPGGVRVLPLEEASLDVLGPLMDLQEVPDIVLADQVIRVLSLLVIEAARDMVASAPDADVTHARSLVGRITALAPDDPEALDLRMELGRFLMAASGNLPMRLIANGLRIQFADRLRAKGITPIPDPISFRRHMQSLDAALEARDGEALADTMRALMALNQKALHAALEAAGATARGLDLLPAPPSRGVRS
ncbi:MAG: GntR family transcriptional regulator [Pseudomonadales bacterium]|nr:GntR family transcriptional regulator [Pseudomonadales bacterium]